MNGRLKQLVAFLGAVAVILVPGALGSPGLTVTILANPSNPSTSPDARFVWRANETASFTCSLDGARPTACTSPASYTGLASGLHDFLVVATNRDRVGTVFTARDQYRWRIELSGPPSPPPPPPTPDRVAVLVVVEGAGKVTSIPAGIACPGDCQESFIAGTPLTLTQQASPGTSFTGWDGACSGVAGCAFAPTAPTAVNAEFDPAGKRPRLLLGDSDDDGVPTAHDRCPQTARAAKAVLHGCAFSDVPGDVDAFDAQIDSMQQNNLWFLRAQTKVQKVDVRLRRLGRLFRTHIANIENALDGAGSDLCGSAKQLALASRGMSSGAATSKALLATLQAAIAKEPAAGGDADAKDLRWASLHHRQRLADAAAKDAKKLLGLVASACDALGPLATQVGRVTKTDEDTGLLEIDDRLVTFDHGKVTGPARIGDLWEGARVKVSARRLGPVWYAESTTLLDEALPKLVLNLQPCVKLLIAPAQDWADPTPVLHDTRGYKANGAYWLEEGMRVAASHECDNAKPESRYSLRVEATSGSSKYLIAHDLTASDGPVALQIPASPSGSSKTWKLQVTERRQGSDCAPPGPTPLLRAPAGIAKSYPCPVVPIGTTTYDVRVRPAAFYATAVFQKKALPVEANGYAENKVTGLSGVHFTLTGTGASFEGIAYKATPTQIPSAFELTKTNETFVVLADSWYGPEPFFFPLATIGVDHLAGFHWPRVVGERNGKPYRYRAQLPLLSKDLLADCPNEKCLYRLPWKFGTLDVTTQGNGPGFSHNGNQLYAFDFGMSLGETIYATRGGIVGDFMEGNSKNYNPCADNNGNGVAGDSEDKKADGPANYLRIDHADGTYSYYAHIVQNGVIPSFGAVVKRGDPVAATGTTGRSCGPHLHYQVAIDPTNTIYGQTTQICFEGVRFPVITFEKCYIPKDGDNMFSTNA